MSEIVDMYMDFVPESRLLAEVFASRVLELWRCAAGVGTWRYGALEMRCRRVDARDLEARCGCRDVYEA